MELGRLRVLIVSEDLPARQPGGAAMHALMLARGLADLGCAVEVLGVAGRADDADNLGFSGVLHRLIDFSGTGWKERSLGCYVPLRRLHMAWRVLAAIDAVGGSWDVIHYHGHFVELGALVPARKAFVQTVHDQGTECMAMTRFKDGRPCRSMRAQDCGGCATLRPNWLQRQVSAAAVQGRRHAAIRAFARHHGLFVSRFLLDRFISNTQCRAPINTTVVHNFVDVDRLLRIASTVQPGRSADERPRVFVSGRIDLAKGIPALLDVFERLRPAVDLRIAGDGPLFGEMQRRYASHASIKLLGWQSHEAVIREVALADLCIVPSLWEEAFGLSTLEALTLGRPVWALRRGATPELGRYASDPAQLRLFESLHELTSALANSPLQAQGWQPNDLADFSRRIPEIAATYREVMARTRA